MGNQQPTPAPGLSYVPDLRKNTAAFVIGGANDTTLELIWNNSGPGEWVALFLGLFLLQSFAINAWTLPWRVKKPCDTKKGFVHPSLKTIEPDATRTPAPKIAFSPKPEDPEPERAKHNNDSTPERPLRLPRK